MTTVVNINSRGLRSMGFTSLDQWLQNPYHVYIGRYNRHMAGASESKWHNPFPMKDESQRQDVCRKFHQYVLEQPELLACLGELEGKVLGCWCKPKACHGDVLVTLTQKRSREAREQAANT